MPQPEGAELEEIRSRRERLRERYLRGPGDRPATPAAGVHHVALICRDVEETIRFYQDFLGFPLVELVENRDYPGSSHFREVSADDDAVAFQSAQRAGEYLGGHPGDGLAQFGGPQRTLLEGEDDKRRPLVGETFPVSLQ